MRFISLAALFSILLTSQAIADAPRFTIKQIGAVFAEAPPGRDKNLVPFGMFGDQQEKVGTDVVIVLENRIFTNQLPTSTNATINATALFKGGIKKPIGTANYQGFGKTTDDKKSGTFNISVSRLPDTPVDGVLFTGKITLSLAKSITTFEVPFVAKAGQVIHGKYGDITISRIDGSSLQLKGDSKLKDIAGIDVIRADGTRDSGSLTMFMFSGDEKGATVTNQWTFSSNVKSGKLALSYYLGEETIDVPIALTVKKPY